VDARTLEASRTTISATTVEKKTPQNSPATINTLAVNVSTKTKPNIPKRILGLCSARKQQNSNDKKQKPDDVPLVDLDYLEKLWEKQERLCFYTNVPMTLNNKDLRSVSVDRVDSDFGYIEGNIVLCCKGINLMKSSASWKETSLFLKDVSDNIDESQMLGEEWDLP